MISRIFLYCWQHSINQPSLRFQAWFCDKEKLKYKFYKAKKRHEAARKQAPLSKSNLPKDFCLPNLDWIELKNGLFDAIEACRHSNFWQITKFQTCFSSTFRSLGTWANCRYTIFYETKQFHVKNCTFERSVRIFTFVMTEKVPTELL